MKILITESQFNYLFESQEVVDRLLDKITDKGYESLTIDEKRYLNHFSRHEGHPDDFIDPAEKEDERKGEKFTSNFGNQPEITFTFDDEEIEGDDIILHWMIEFGNKTYWGVLITNKLGHLIDLDFSDADYDMGSESEEPERFQDQVEGMEYEVRGFFEDEVIPNLIG
jgi:hypothetical protein